MKRLMVIASLAIVLANLLGLGANLAAPAEAAAAANRTINTYYTGQFGPFGLPAVKWELNGQFTVTNGKIYNVWKTCRALWAVGYTVEMTWCGTVYNGSSSYMEIGANYNLHVLIKGFPGMRSCWMRTRVYPSGYYTSTGGC